MSNASRISFRGSGVGRRGWWIPWCLLGLLVSASGAMAAEIVEVRVGRHAEFTRVVFELDRQVGYRIERSSSTPDVAELVVSVEATSIPRRIQSSSGLIEQVEVEPRGPRSVARIRLGKQGLKLKEMILASPPRIVLDVLSDAPPPKKVAAAKPTPKPAPTPAPSDEPAAKPEPVRRPVASSEREQATRTVATPEREAPSAVQPQRQAVQPERAPVEVARRADARPDPGAARQAMEDAAPSTGGAPAAAAAKESGAIARRSSDRPVDAADLETAPGAQPARAPSAADRALERMDRQARPDAKPGQKPMVARSRPPAKAEEEGGGWLMWAMVGLGVVLLAGAGLLFVRRHNAGEEVDFSQDDEAEGAFDDAPVSAEANPFADMAEEGDQMNLTPSDEPTMPALMEEDAASGIDEDSEKESETVVFDEGVEGETMDVISREQVNESLGQMPPVGGVSEEIAQMMRAMERRVQALEGRIDELVDARDRLERQVAAQTEELRVQRAAIARTQRAVRNLARPEEESGAAAHEEATEPALRDPNKPSMDS